MSHIYQIVPGESVGPFKLGMTRDDVLALGISPMVADDDRFIHFPMVQDDSWKEPGHVAGINVTFDESNVCVEIEARFGYKAGPLRQRCAPTTEL